MHYNDNTTVDTVGSAGSAAGFETAGHANEDASLQAHANYNNL